VRATQLVFGPPSPFPVAFRVNGPDLATVRTIAAQVQAVMQADPMMRTVNADWGDRVPALHFVLDQDRLQALGLTSGDVANQLQFLLTGVTVSQARETSARSMSWRARRAGKGSIRPVSAITRWWAHRASASPSVRSARSRCAWRTPSCNAATACPPSPCAATLPTGFSPRRLHRDAGQIATDHQEPARRVSHRHGRFD
jgi:hypothetical protein